MNKILGLSQDKNKQFIFCTKSFKMAGDRFEFKNRSEPVVYRLEIIDRKSFDVDTRLYTYIVKIYDTILEVN